jgi:hypothetical protein
MDTILFKTDWGVYDYGQWVKVVSAFRALHGMVV